MLSACLEKMEFINHRNFCHHHLFVMKRDYNIDDDLDIKVYPNGKDHLLDEDEYEQHMNQMNYPHDIDIILLTWTFFNNG